MFCQKKKIVLYLILFDVLHPSWPSIRCLLEERPVLFKARIENLLTHRCSISKGVVLYTCQAVVDEHAMISK